MASFRKRAGNWTAEIRRKGVYRTQTFRTKAAAEAWARQLEASVDAGELSERSTATLHDAFEKFMQETTPGRKGARWEKVRLKKLQRDPLAEIRFRDILKEDFEEFRDRRLKEVKPSSVNRELNLLSGVMTHAQKKWGWIDTNPVHDVDRPKNPKHRERRPTEEEVTRICWRLGFDGEEPAVTSQQQTALAFLLAIETAMRQSEIANLTPQDLRLDNRYVIIRDSKNNDARHVALTKEAVRLLKLLPSHDGPRLFRPTGDTISQLFMEARKDCGIEGLTFHDSRHEAMTRLARKLTVLDLMKQVGVRDPRTLTTYYNPTATEIAQRLD